ncbi:MAG: hypothetical protein R3276_12195, partial [Marinobacter sp.]|nr:hypothetical protein [Marinobacter sp.]
SLKDSVFVELPNGKIFSIDKHVFLSKPFPAEFVFNIKQTTHVEVFCTEKFRSLVESSGFFGLSFIPVVAVKE